MPAARQFDSTGRKTDVASTLNFLSQFTHRAQERGNLSAVVYSFGSVAAVVEGVAASDLRSRPATSDQSESRNAPKVTTTVSIIFATSPNPIGSGLAESLAHPGGNIIGLSLMTLDDAIARCDCDPAPPEKKAA